MREVRDISALSHKQGEGWEVKGFSVELWVPFSLIFMGGNALNLVLLYY